MNHRAFTLSIDGLSLAAIAGTFAGWLPPLAALAGIVWYAVQIWESKTVQKWVRLRRAKERARRLADETIHPAP